MSRTYKTDPSWEITVDAIARHSRHAIIGVASGDQPGFVAQLPAELEVMNKEPLFTANPQLGENWNAFRDRRSAFWITNAMVDLINGGTWDENLADLLDRLVSGALSHDQAVAIARERVTEALVDLLIREGTFAIIRLGASEADRMVEFITA